MEDNFRNVLIILSGIVIGAIFIHGLWTIRKQKNPYKLKASKRKVEPLTRNFDGKGFDQDGVGQVIVKKQTFQQQDDEVDKDGVFSTASTANALTEEEQVDVDAGQVLRQETMNDNVSEPNLFDSVANRSNNEAAEKSDSPVNDSLDASQNEHWLDNDVSSNFSKDELGDDLTPIEAKETSENEVKEVVSDPVYQQPVIHAKPAIKPTRQSIRKSATKTELKRDQMEINFGDVKVVNETMPNIIIDEPVEQPNLSAKHSQSKAVPSKPVEQINLEPQVIIISVVMPANQQMLGAVLLPSLLTLGLKYGEMNIFHRHLDNAGNGDVTFSIANMMKPGSFDLDSMETFATQGISLFMTLPNAANPLAVFEQMLNAAKQLAQEFNGQILDDKRNVMTKQTEQHYMSKVREFDRKSRIALAQ